MSADTRVIDAAAGAARADLRPYVVRMYDRWIILAIILLVAWSPWVRGLFAFTLYYRGLSFERMLVLTTAEHYYKKSIAVYDKIPWGWVGLGELYFMQAPGSHDYYEKSLDTFNRGFALNPKSFTLAFDLGRTYFLGKDYRSALAAFDRAIAINPRDRFALDYAAWSALREGNRPLALQYWRELLAVFPTDEPVIYLLHKYGG